ncbi:MAG: ABC transporter substrate-binding protein [Proteobacteria bacterium]|nr:ABC transporter substrate-binding protein [Pseudomonadota bacterium]
MMTRLTRTLFACATLLCCVLTFQAASAAPGGDAGAFVKELGDRAIQALTVKEISDAEREERFRTLLRDGFDVRKIGRFVLGRYVRSMSPDVVEEYNKLFEDLIVATYAARFAEYSGQTFEIKRVAAQGNDHDSIVMSEIRPTDGGPPIRVDWQVRSEEKESKIVDVRVEGVSMSLTQRDEFTAVIQKNGGNVDSLLEALRKKAANLKSRQ